MQDISTCNFPYLDPLNGTCNNKILEQHLPYYPSVFVAKTKDGTKFNDAGVKF